MKRKIVSLVAFLSVSVAMLANNGKGIEFYKVGMYDAAKDEFLQQSGQSIEEQVIAAYYLGLIYANEQNIEAAAAQFQKAIDLNPKSPYGYIGKGRLELKNNVKAGEALLKQAESLGKKNAAVLVAIAEAYFANNMIAKVQPLLEKAKTADKNNVDIYLLEGNVILSKGSDSETIGKAISKIGDADYFSNSTDKVVLIKLAQLYRMVGGMDFALDNVNKALAIDNNFPPANTELGNIKYAQAKYKEAIEAYEKALATSVKVPDEYYGNYAYALFFDKQYEKSLQEIEKNLLSKPNNVTLLRLQAYNMYELKQYEEGLAKMEKFFATVPHDKQISLDFITLGRFYLALKNYDSAIESFNKAIARDAQATDTYKELSRTYSAMKNYDEAIQYFEKYVELTKNVLPSEWNALGQLYTDAAVAMYLNNKDNVKALQANQQLFDTYIEKGAKVYSDLITLAPNLHVGYTGRAYIYSLVDTYENAVTGKHKGVAIPYYEEALTFMLANNTEDRFNSDIVDAYLYFAGYYIKNDDTKNAVEYYKKALAIDPTNERATSTLKQLKVRY